MGGKGMYVKEKCTCGSPHISDMVIHCYDGKPCYLKPREEVKEKSWWRKEYEQLIMKFGDKEFYLEPSIEVDLLIQRIISQTEDRTLERLVTWIDENVGISSESIYLYMTIGRVPDAFYAPSDRDDRRRCVKLLQAIPQWIDRLSEIEALKIEGISISGEKVTPWNEQIPIIRSDIADAILKEK